MTQAEPARDTSLKVAVAPERVVLRKMQFALNQVLWSTELSYGFFLKKATTEFPDKMRPADEVLGDVWTEAWHPNSRGRTKLTTTIGFLEQRVGENYSHLYRSVLITFSSYFEDYLNTRIEERGGGWGSYVSLYLRCKTAG